VPEVRVTATAPLPDGGATLSPADLLGVLGALDHAEQLMRERAAQFCDDCAVHPAGACESHVEDLDQADAYAALAGRLEDGDVAARLAAAESAGSVAAARDLDKDQVLARISESAGLLSWYVGVWGDLGYASPEPGQHAIPPLGERSAGCLEGARAATRVIDAITRDLAELRVQPADEILADEDARDAAAADAAMAEPGDFHRLIPAGECIDTDCTEAGEHSADRRGPGAS
jgi:hypothetical protein